MSSLAPEPPGLHAAQTSHPPHLCCSKCHQEDSCHYSLPSPSKKSSHLDKYGRNDDGSFWWVNYSLICILKLIIRWRFSVMFLTNSAITGVFCYNRAKYRENLEQKTLPTLMPKKQTPSLWDNHLTFDSKVRVSSPSNYFIGDMSRNQWPSDIVSQYFSIILYEYFSQLARFINEKNIHWYML